ncbi:ARMC5 [Mytilus coruscus]|uniref:ARMC5 n=1 Tax=Mytilus coruscus TaxID=42192 RepID=A0A6J8CM85_MYTCO|nr:ARMC5 [Mytilus coruscus]
MDQKARKTIQKLISKLDNSSENGIFNCLVEIRKNVLKTKEGISYLLKNGGIPKILQILQKSDTDNKSVDVILSTLGNLCMDSDARNMVRRSSGIEIIAHVFGESKTESIQNRCSRTLANLALTKENIVIILKADAAETLGKLLKSTKTKENILTYSRTVRLLVSNNRQMEKLLLDDVVLYLAKHLSDSEAEVKHSILRTIHEISAVSCSVGFASQIVSSGALPDILSLMLHSDSTIVNQSITVINRLSNQPNFRAGLGSAGGIKIILDIFHDKENDIDKNTLLNILCMCCKDGVNRIKIRDNEILELFIECLYKDEYRLLHDKVISALQCFLYDDPSISVLLEHGLIKVLVSHLQRVAKFESVVCQAEDLIPTFINKDQMNEEMLKEQEMFKKLYQFPHQVDSRCNGNVIEKNMKTKVQLDNVEGKEEKRKSVVYSMDSPSYIPHSSWDIDQYTKGEKCKQVFVKNDTESSEYSPLSTVSYYSPKSNSESSGESPTNSNQYSLSPSKFSFSSPGCSSWSVAESTPENWFSVSTVNKDPNYSMVCSIPYSCGSPEKCESPMASSPVPFQQDEAEFSSCESEDDELEDENSRNKIDKSKEKQCDVLLLDNITQIKMEETLDMNEIKHTVDKIDQTVEKQERETTIEQMPNVKGDSIKQNDTNHMETQTKRTKMTDDGSDIDVENPSKRRKLDSLESDLRSSRHVKETENQILILLSCVSQMNDPSQHIVTIETVCCLLDYLHKVDNPQPRAARILSRLAKNPLCFEKLLKMKFIMLVYYKLCLYKYEDEIDKLSKTDNCILQISQVKRCTDRRKSSGSDHYGYRNNSQYSFLDNLIKISESIPSDKNERKRSAADREKNVMTSEEEKSYFKAQVGLTLLQDLCIQADSHFGRGEVERLVYRYPDIIREWLAVDVLYILWLRGMHGHYFRRMHFLTKIFDILQNITVNTPKCQAALQGLVFLGKMNNFQMKCEDKSFRMDYVVHESEDCLNIVDVEPESEGCLNGVDMDISIDLEACKFDCAEVSHKVVFLVENQKLVCCRNLLSESSPLFTAMLHGKFLEANKNEIVIEDTTFYAFRYLIHYLYKCTDKCHVTGHFLVCDKSIENVYHCLEVFSLAIKYLVYRLQTFLLQVLSKHLMTAESCCHVFDFALLHDFSDLADDSVICVTKRGNNLERMRGLYKFICGQNKDAFLVTLKDLYTSSL